MPERRVFRGAGGRFISAAQAEENAVSVDILDTSTGERRIVSAEDYFRPSFDDSEPPPPPFEESYTERGAVWSGFDSDYTDDLGVFDPPSDASHFRVFVNVPDNPDYPRGWASTGWMSIDAWPPSLDMVKGQVGTGYNQVRFDRT